MRFVASSARVFDSSASRVRLRSLVSADVRSLPSRTAFSEARSRFLRTSRSSRWALPAARSARSTFSSRAAICSR